MYARFGLLATLLPLFYFGAAIDSTAAAQCPAVFGDVDGNGATTVNDVQCAILNALYDIGGQVGTPPACTGATGAADVNCSGSSSVTDIQLVIGAVLKLPLHASIDTNANGCPDTCDAPLCGAAGCAGDCCGANGSPGCDSADCTECVCAADSFCCETTWDQLCADRAQIGCLSACPECACGDGICGADEDCVTCAIDCGACTGSCCESDETVGCQDSECQDCVCGADGFCCDTLWDQLCADRAQTGCLSACPGCACGDGVCGADESCVTCAADCGACTGSCCHSGSAVGCQDTECQDCVCGADAFCCESSWDQLCANRALTGCLSACPECTCGDGICAPDEDCVTCAADCGACTGSCCQPGDTVGCQDSECQDCVCAADAFCCESSWDQICANATSAGCASACPACACGAGGCAEDCCADQGSNAPGCSSTECESCVCALDPFCCNTTWDDLCAFRALTPCADACLDCQQCGDGQCDTWEDCETCGLDCGICSQVGSCVGSCGGADPSGTCFCDSVCVVTGDCCDDACSVCPSEFAPGACPTCGDGVCDVMESCASCAADCGPCVVPNSCAGQCGSVPTNGDCSCGSSCFSQGNCCFDVCDSCGSEPGFGSHCSCGDGVCTTGESCAGCPIDCGACVPPDSCEGRCGGKSADGSCSCSADCLESGNCCDDVCDECLPAFPPGTCPVCGDNSCHPLEKQNGGCTFDCGVGFGPGACKGRCGGPGINGGCFCDVSCFSFGDCCPDVCSACSDDPAIEEACYGCGDGFCADDESCSSCPDDCGVCFLSCNKACGTSGAFCSCDADCVNYGDCCLDICNECPSNPGCTGCGNGICSGEENCGTCPEDCGCPIGAPCDGFICSEPKAVTVGGCPTVDVSYCRDSDYLETACGQVMLAEAAASATHPCRKLLGNSINDSSAGLQSQLVVPVPVADKNGTITPPSGPRVEADLEPSDGDSTHDALSPLELFARFFWDSNGDDVSSCEEYAYERFHYYSRFDDEARALGSDYRGIYELAFGNVFLDPAVATLTLMQGKLYDKSGQPSLPLPQPTAATPKNYYFDVSDAFKAVLEAEANEWSTFQLGTVGPFGTVIQAFGPDPILQAMLAGFSSAQKTTKNLAWHQSMEAQLSYDPATGTGWLDEELNARFDHQVAFRALADQYERALFAWGTRQSACSIANIANGGVNGPVNALIDELQHLTTPEEELQRQRSEFQQKCSSSAMQALEANADAQWAAVRAHLAEAKNLGCFAPGPGPCDWSPKLFSTQFRSGLDKEKKRAQLACQEWAPASFYTLADYSFPLIGDMTTAEFPAHVNYLDNTLKLESFAPKQKVHVLRVVEEIAQLLGLPPEQSDPFRLAQSASKSDKLGRDDYFSVHYSYEAAWSVYGVDNIACNLNATFDGGANAGFTILNKKFDVVRVDATVDGLVSQGGAPAGGHLTVEVLDNVLASPPTMSALYDESWSGFEQPSFTLVDDTWSDEASANFNGPTFPILGIPVRIGAGFGGTFAASALMTVDADTGCNQDFGVRLNSQFTPSLGFTGFVTVAIDYAILKAGIKGEVTLIELSMPLSIDIRANAPNGNLNQIDLQATTQGDLVLQTLDGRIKLFAEILFEEYEKTIFRWEGITRSFRLFDVEFVLPLRILDMACDAGLIDC